MSQLLDDLFKAQPDVLFMIAGLILIGIGVVGSIKTYIDPGMYGRVAALGIGVILLAVGFTLYWKAAKAIAQKPAATSSICTFDAGPSAGSTSQLPETDLGPVGSPCQDTAGNKGILVAPDTPLTKRSKAGARAEGGNAAQPATPTPASGSAADQNAQASRICTFKTGPHAGATHELPRAQPQAIGSPCHDRKGDSGSIVAANTPITP
jgi:hypothetical protein